MARPDQGEMPAVGGEDRDDAQALGLRHDRGVDETEWRVPVGTHQFGRADDVFVVQWFDGELAAGQRADEGLFGLRPYSRSQQIADFRNDGDRKADPPGAAGPPGDNPVVPAVGAVDQGIDGPGVGQDGQLWGSRQRSSSTRSAVSAQPDANWPATDGRRVAGSWALSR